MYDTLKFRNILIEAGLNEKQANGIVKGMTDIVMDDIATKTDLDQMGDRLTIRFGGMLIVAVAALSAIVKLT